MANNSIENYTRALQDLQATAERTKRTLQDLQARMARGDNSIVADFNKQIEVARELSRAYRELESERKTLMQGPNYADNQATQNMERQIRQAHELEQAYRELNAQKNQAAGGYIAGGATPGPAPASAPPRTSAMDLVPQQYKSAVDKARRSLEGINKTIGMV